MPSLPASPPGRAPWHVTGSRAAGTRNWTSRPLFQALPSQRLPIAFPAPGPQGSAAGIVSPPSVPESWSSKNMKGFLPPTQVHFLSCSPSSHLSGHLGIVIHHTCAGTPPPTASHFQGLLESYTHTHSHQSGTVECDLHSCPSPLGSAGVTRSP